MDLPVSIVDVHRILEDGRPLHQRDLLPAVDLVLQVGGIPLHLRNQPVLPPVGEIEAVGRQHRVEIATDLGGVLGVVLRHARVVHIPVLHRFEREIRVRRYGRRVEVTVHVLGDPVGRKRRAESTKHVVAGQPPTSDVEVHRGQRLRTMQVVVHPEEALLSLVVPPDREVLVTKELLDDLAFVGHEASFPGSTRSASADPPGPSGAFHRRDPAW